MQRDDGELERYLKEFRPRGLRPLEVPPRRRDVWLQRLIAAAVLLFAVSVSLWYARRAVRKPLEPLARQEVPAPPQHLQRRSSTFVLTRLALEDPAQFDAWLTEQSRNVLPDMQGAHSTLQILARE